MLWLDRFKKFVMRPPKMDEKKPRIFNFNIGKHLICAAIALGVAIFGLVISLPPIDITYYNWYPQYLSGLLVFQSSLFDTITFVNLNPLKDASLKPIEQTLQSDHKVNILLPKRWTHPQIIAGATVNLLINQQPTPLTTTLKCNALILNYTIDYSLLASDGKSYLRNYDVSNINLDCNFISKYGLDNYILIEQDPLLLLAQLSHWNLDFFSMSAYPAWLRTISLAFLTFPGLTIMYFCSICFYKRYRFRYKVIYYGKAEPTI